ncbi:MAG TPA: cation:proton antiporter [Dehalococcoidia bacterium]|nr:cation:proton antiporter [Dehalococcoidia bacterium]
MLGTPIVESLLLGAILVSVDPVVLHDVVRDRRIPRSVRLALKIEAGTNDILVLPLILVLSAIALSQIEGAASAPAGSGDGGRSRHRSLLGIFPGECRTGMDTRTVRGSGARPPCRSVVACRLQQMAAIIKRG